MHPWKFFRCANWISECGGEHLKSINPALLNKKHRLCADDFENCRFANFQNNRHKSEAIATLFDHQVVSETINNESNTNNFVF